MENKTFLEKLRTAQTVHKSCVCLGLDPDPKKFPAALGKEGQATLAFCKAIIEATADVVCAFKPNLAFFLSQGSVEVLREVIAHIPPQIPIILDAKFGDIGNTAEHYAAFVFDYLRADAVTVSPYIGTDAIRPFVEHRGKLAFVLARTSNTEGNEFQNWPDAKAPLYQEVTRQMIGLSTTYPNQIGLVVGATQSSDIAAVRAQAPDLPFLVPGIGTQGGDLSAVLEFGVTHTGIDPVINISRAALYASNGSDFAQAARQRILELRSEIDSIRTKNVSA